MSNQPALEPPTGPGRWAANWCGCTTGCAALTRHHTGEDAVVFPTLARQLPELAPVLARLSQDHQLVEGILRQLRQLLTTMTPATRESVRREIDGLSAILESHFRWEERKLVSVLDTVVTDRPANDLFGPASRGVVG
jgi:hemerythrin-like domain-containing protein